MTPFPVGLPRDPAQWLALALAPAVILAARRLLALPGRSRVFLAACSLAAATLSAAYVVVYLRGGPRIIDASSYWLEARGIAQGLLSFPLHAPETSVLGRFLVRSEHPDGPHVAVIFPPGYPAVLALGFLAHAPLAVGPVLAAAVTLATFDLAARASPEESRTSVARVAALLSVVCAALRYHTADTMSHGLSALCVACSLSFVFRALDAHTARLPRRGAAFAAAAGLALGLLVATRPVSALALCSVLVYVLLRDHAPRSARVGSLLAVAALAVPGAALLLAHQHAATGAWTMSSQRLYYAVSDGPPGCFRYGFGAGVGCVVEHADFVGARLADGYGALAAAGTTLRRLKMHLIDPANMEPLALLVPLGAWLLRASPRGRALGLSVLAQIAVYVPFYFDGNYPGGGARLFCDVLPVEHVLAAAAVASLASRTRAPERWAAAAPALALAGFAFRAGFEHAMLRDRDGGRPLFEPTELARAGVTRGLVFVDTDHGFNLAYDPGGAVQIARLHGDAVDRMAWEARGRPPAFFYRLVPPKDGGVARVEVEPLSFPLGDEPPIEGESLWPPLTQQDGWASIAWAATSCASGGRWLALSREARASFTVELPAPWLAGDSVAPRVAAGEGARGDVLLHADGGVVQRWSFAAPDGAGVVCLDLAFAGVPQGARRVTLSVERRTANGLIALDAVLRQRGWDRRPSARPEND